MSENDGSKEKEAGSEKEGEEEDKPGKNVMLMVERYFEEQSLSVLESAIAAAEGENEADTTAIRDAKRLLATQMLRNEMARSELGGLVAAIAVAEKGGEADGEVVEVSTNVDA